MSRPQQAKSNLDGSRWSANHVLSGKPPAPTNTPPSGLVASDGVFAIANWRTSGWRDGIDTRDPVSCYTAQDVTEQLKLLGLQNVATVATQVWKSRVARVWQAEFKDKLSEAEAFSILAYTVEEQPCLYGCVNGTLQPTTSDTAALLQIVRVLHRGISKLDKVEHETAFRGLRVTTTTERELRCVLEGTAWRVGDVIEFNTLSSFTTTAETASLFSGPANVNGVVLKVLGGVFRNVSKLSAHPAETELLDAPPTAYKITSRDSLTSKNVLFLTAIPVSPTAEDPSAQGTQLVAPLGLRGKSLFPEQEGRSGLYSTREDKLVAKFAQEGRFDDVNMMELRDLLKELFQAKFTRYGSVTKSIAVPGSSDENDDRMEPNNIFTKLTLVEVKTVLDANRETPASQSSPHSSKEPTPSLGPSPIASAGPRSPYPPRGTTDRQEDPRRPRSNTAQEARTRPLMAFNSLSQAESDSAEAHLGLTWSNPTSPMHQPSPPAKKKDSLAQSVSTPRRSTPCSVAPLVGDMPQARSIGSAWSSTGSAPADTPHPSPGEAEKTEVVPVEPLDLTVRSLSLDQQTDEEVQAQMKCTEVTRLEAQSIVDEAVRCRVCREQKRFDRCDECRRLLCVEGRAGIGKSTFAMQLAREQPSESCVFVILQLGLLGSFLPEKTGPDADLSFLQVLGVALSPLAQDSSDKSKDIHKLKGVPKATIEALWGSRHIPIVWVLDGLDEVGPRTDGRIQDFLTQILATDRKNPSTFWEQRPLDAVIVTSREEKGHYGGKLAGKPTLQIDMWSEKEVREYVGRYFKVDMTVAPKESTATKATEVLLSTALGSFARLPITCELVCFVVDKTDAEVPDVAVVYERAVQEIYKNNNNKDRRTKAVEDKTADERIFISLDFAKVREAATKLGLEVAQRYQKLKSRDEDKVDQLGMLAVEIPKTDDLSFSLIYSGWFRHVRDDLYQFVHKSFMEYFAARALAGDINQLKLFNIDVGQGAQQRNLLVLLATILVQPDALNAEESVEAFQAGVTKSFEKHFKVAEREVDAKLKSTEKKFKSTVSDKVVHLREVAELADRTGCSTVSEVAKVLYARMRTSFDIASYKNLEDGPPYPELCELKTPFMNGIDLCAGTFRRVERIFTSDVPPFYLWMIEPMARQNALRPLMFVQRQICQNSETFEQARDLKLYDAALLQAEVAGARYTAHFLSQHCDARLDLELAAQIGATAVLKRDLAERTDIVQIVGKLFVAALGTKQVDTAGVILSVAFGQWPAGTSTDVVFVEVATCVLDAAESDVPTTEMLNVFGHEAKPKCMQESVLNLKGYAPAEGFRAPPVVFVARAIEAEALILDGMQLTHEALKEVVDPANNLLLSSISVRGVLLDDRVASLVTPMSSLVDLDLSHIAAFGDDGLMELLQCGSLQKLKLVGTAVTDAGLLRAVHLLHQLRYLTVHDNAIYGGEKNTIPVTDLIYSLDLRRPTRSHEGSPTGSSNVAIEDLQLFPNLRSVVLGGNPVRDQDLGHLILCKNLRVIDLSNTCVSDSSRLDTSEADRHALTALRRLKLFLPLNDEANPPPERRLLSAISWMTSIASLDLRGHVSSNELREVIKRAPHVKVLSLTELQENTAENISAMLDVLPGVFPELQELVLRGVYVSDWQLPVLVPCRKLLSLDLRDTHVVDERKAVWDTSVLLGQVTLADAAASGHSAVCKYLIQSRNVPVDAPQPAVFVPGLAPPEGHNSIAFEIPEWPPLFHAVLHGHIDTCSALLAQHADLKKMTSGGLTALHIAAAYGHSNICELLVANAADVNALALDSSMPPIFFSAHNQHKETCRKMIGKKCRADVNFRNNGGLTPLAFAAREGLTSTCSVLLLDCKASVDAQRNDGATPLLMASRNDHIETCELLLRCGADINKPDNDGDTPVFSSTVQCLNSLDRHMQTLQVLLSYSPDVTLKKSGKAPLWVAAERENVTISELLMYHGADVDCVDENEATPLWMAAQKGSLEICQMLVGRGAEIDKENKTRTTPLYVAVQNGHSSICELLIKNQANVNVSNENEETPLWIASSMGHSAICEMLIPVVGDLNSKSKDGKQTPLFVAASNGHVEVCRLLINARARMNPSPDGEPAPLLAAVCGGHVRICRLLCDGGSIVNFPNSEGVNPLYAAARIGNAAICKLLLSKGAAHTRNKKGESPLWIAACMGHLEVCKLLLTNRAAEVANECGESPFWIAACNGLTEICELLLTEDVAQVAVSVKMREANRAGESALWIAAFRGQLEMCKLLLRRGASPSQANVNGVTPLYTSVANGHSDVCKLFLRNIAPGDRREHCRQLLHVAVDSGHSETCELMLTNGADVHMRDCDGKTPLLHAALNQDPDMCALLLRHRADVNNSQEDGDTPYIALRHCGSEICTILIDEVWEVNATRSGETLLHIAAATGNLDACRQLIEREVDVNNTNIEEEAALHISARNGHTELCELLLRGGSGCNDPGKHEATPLHFAAEHGHAETCSLLISFGANVNSTNQYGETPLSCARQNGHTATERVLQDSGAI